MTATGEPDLFDLNDYREDPVVLAMHAINLAIASWEDDVRDEVLLVLGELSISCSKGSRVYHLPVASLLVQMRVLIAAVTDRVESSRGRSDVASGGV